MVLPTIPETAAASPPNRRAEPGTTYRVEVDGRSVFTEKFRDVSIASFSLATPAVISVFGPGPIKRFNISPHSAGIMATARESALTFTLDRPQYLVVTIDGGEKLFLFADGPNDSTPRLGDARVTSVLDLGIDATGERLETARLQEAIDRVAAAGGVLYFPAGTYLTGTLALKSNLMLYLAEGARLLGSSKVDDYPVEPGCDERNLRSDPELWLQRGGVDIAYRRLLLIDGAQNVRIAGRGTIEGRGGILRKQGNITFVLVRRSSDVVFEGITLLDSPMYNVHVLGSERVVFRKVKIVSDQRVANTDGINPDSSRDVSIEDCFFYCGDDCIAIKTSGADGVRGDAELITVRNCVFMSTTSAVKLGTNTFAGSHRNILFENNDVLEADRAINLSCEDGHGFDDIRFVDLRIERLVGRRLQFPVHIHADRRSPGGSAGRIHDVLLENVSVEEEYPAPSKLEGFSPEHDVRGIRFVNYVVAGRVRLNAADANVTLGPFVSDVTFTGPSSNP